MKEKTRPTRVHADPQQWSESSKKSLVYSFASDEYADIHYLCRRCGAAAVYPAEDQRLDYEVLKAYIWQRRNLCPKCWHESKAIAKQVRACEEKWGESKESLKKDAAFLSNWLQLLISYEAYGARPNSAIKNMLERLIGENSPGSAQ